MKYTSSHVWLLSLKDSKNIYDFAVVMTKQKWKHNFGQCSLFLFFQAPRWLSHFGCNDASAQSSLMWTFWLWENRETVMWRIISILKFRINCGESAKATFLPFSESLLFFLPNESFLLLLSNFSHNISICTALMLSVGLLIIGFHWLKTYQPLFTTLLSSLKCSSSPSG